MKSLRKYTIIARVSFTNAITYRMTILSQFIFFTLFVYVYISLWGAIYQEGGVHGYSYAQIVWYLLMTEFIGFASGTSIYSGMNEEVKSGAIAYQIGRPVHYVLYQFANFVGQTLPLLICFGFLAGLLGLVFVGPLPGFRLAGLPTLILSFSLSILLNYFFLMLIGLSAFVLEDNYAVFLIYQKLGFMLGMLLPVEFLPSWLQPVAKSLPFSYVYWAPAKIFVNYSPEICVALIPRQAAWAVSAIALTFLCYRLSVRRLQINGG